MRKPCLCTQNTPLYITSIISPSLTAKTARYRGVRYNAKQYPPLYQTYATAEFRDYTARISADKRGGTLHDPPQYKTHPPVY